MSKRTKLIENFTLLIYIIALTIVSIFHEPWFDEAQAWLIARDNNLFEVLFNVLRYEGHTPLWHIFLYIPSHMGIPYEIGLKSINLLLISLSTFLLIKKSPFPLIIRLILPFTYFLFYQYGVINRSYSLLVLILWLAAYKLPIRNKKPFMYSIILALLGSVTAHGMLIAFGIAVAWIVEIVMYYKHVEKTFVDLLNSIVKDRRFHALVFLGFINVFYVLILWPKPDKYTPMSTNLDLINIIFKSIISPINGVFSQTGDIFYRYPALLSVLIVIGLVLLSVFFIWCLNKGVYLYALLPYFFTSFFMTLVYFSLHHTGIYTILFIFALWISLSNESVFKPPMWAFKKYNFYKKLLAEKKVFKRSLFIVFGLIFLIQLYWTIIASINDIKLPYSASSDLAKFIEINGIQDRRILNSYSVFNDEVSYSTTNIDTLPYFSRNIFYNHNFGDRDISYVTHKEMDKKKVLKYLSESPSPEFIVDYKQNIEYLPSFIKIEDYVSIATFDSYYMWKSSTRQIIWRVYIKKELLPQFPQFIN